jgi:hypothetical protein
MAYKFQAGAFNLGGNITLASGTTLDAASGDIELPNSSVDTADVTDAAITAAKIASSVAGNGLSGGAGAALALDLNELSAAAVDVAADSIAIIDAGDNSSKKESIADLMTAAAGNGLSAASGVLALDLSELSAASVDAGADSLVLIDASDSNASKKESVADLATAMAGTVTTTGLSAASGVFKLDIQNMTASSAVADADLVVIDDGAGGTLRKMTRAYFIESAALDSINIDGGAIDGTPIGANSPNTAVFTTATVNSSLLPDASGGADIGSASAEFGDVYVADDKYLQMGSDQDVKIGYDEAGRDGLLIEAKEAAALDMYLMADNGDDAGDEWKIRVADGGVMTFGNDIASAGTHVSLLTMTPNSTTVDSNMTWAGDLTVSGDLTINGDLTTVATTNTVVKDLRIELGNGTAGSAASDAGIIIERGDDDNVGIIWDESADLFALIDGSFTGGTAGNDLTIADYMGLKLGALTATDASDFEAGVKGQDVRIGLTAANEIDTDSGNLVLDSAGGTVDVQDALSCTGDFSCGSSKFDVTAGNGNLSMAGDLTVSGTGMTSFAGTLKASAGSVINVSSSTISKTLTTGNHFVIADVQNGQTMTLTLPQAVEGQTDGFLLKIKAGANCDGSDTVTIDGHSAQTVDGAANVVLNSPYAAVNLVASGSGWFIW